MLPLVHSRAFDRSTTPLISCLMVSRGHLVPARFAIDCFRRQTWPNRELVIACGAHDSELPDYLATLDDSAIRYLSVAPGVLGALRNLTVEAARGMLLCQWDDDDLYHPQRLEHQYAQLVAGRAAAHFVSRLLMWWPEERRFGISARRLWENSMLCRRLALGSYPLIARREDTHVVKELRARGHRTTYTDQPLWYCYIVHGANTSGSRHMAKLFTKATETFGPDEYEDRLEQFSTIFPLHAYREALARLDHGGPSADQ